MRTPVLMAIAAAAAVLGAVCLIADRGVHARERSVSGWAAADATVLSAAIDRRPNAEGQPGFAPVVDYRFIADGQQYRGGRLGFDREWSASQDEVRQWLQPMLEGAQLMPGQSGGMFGTVFAALPVDKHVTVYFDPADPSDNIADRRDPHATAAFRWLGAALLLLGLGSAGAGGALLLARQARKPKATWVGDLSRREPRGEGPSLPQERVAMTTQLALDMAFEAMVRFAKGGPDPARALRERFPALSPAQIDDTLSKAKVLESVCYGAAARVKAGMTEHEAAVTELAASYPGFSEQTYRSALAWGLQQCK
ncbi:MAG TPA: DUF3592 domain-containing protein [Candidatus Edwardsbacteria bacterium]|nr:DUF3592 domain-containing protein [Candidatus Edwardsbacteria bacterium]